MYRHRRYIKSLKYGNLYLATTAFHVPHLPNAPGAAVLHATGKVRCRGLEAVQVEHEAATEGLPHGLQPSTQRANVNDAQGDVGDVGDEAEQQGVLNAAQQLVALKYLEAGGWVNLGGEGVAGASQDQQ